MFSNVKKIITQTLRKTIFGWWLNHRHRFHSLMVKAVKAWCLAFSSWMIPAWWNEAWNDLNDFTGGARKYVLYIYTSYHIIIVVLNRNKWDLFLVFNISFQESALSKISLWSYEFSEAYLHGVNECVAWQFDIHKGCEISCCYKIGEFNIRTTYDLYCFQWSLRRATVAALSRCRKLGKSVWNAGLGISSLKLAQVPP